MGRYYGTAHFDGKFGFGVQSSYDPVDVFGMWDESSDDDECEANFFLEASDDALSHIKNEIDNHTTSSKYRLLGVYTRSKTI